MSKDIEIKIELPNGLIDFFLKFPILSIFKNKHEMSINKLPHLIVSPELNSNIQIVYNYLKLLKNGNLAYKDLFIKNVFMNFKELLNFECIKENTRIDAESLPLEECENLIIEFIGFKNPNFYQINSFLNILSGQLKRFSINFELSAGNLIQCGNRSMVLLKTSDIFQWEFSKN